MRRAPCRLPPAAAPPQTQDRNQRAVQKGARSGPSSRALRRLRIKRTAHAPTARKSLRSARTRACGHRILWQRQMRGSGSDRPYAKSLEIVRRATSPSCICMIPSSHPRMTELRARDASCTRDASRARWRCCTLAIQSCGTESREAALSESGAEYRRARLRLQLA